MLTFVLIFIAINLLLKGFLYRALVENFKEVKEAQDINNEYIDKFYKFNRKMNMEVVEVWRENKQAYDNMHTAKALDVYVEENLERLKREYEQLIANSYLYEEYDKKIRAIKISGRFRGFKRDAVFASMLTPDIRSDKEVVVRYTSPAGRNAYRKSAKFTQNFIMQTIEAVEAKREAAGTRQAQIARERSLMTSSVRFDVLNRDNFTCQYCGTKASDGVKLHVDHVHPVSKGGKTEMSNLVTACEHCNLGKSNKVIK